MIEVSIVIYFAVNIFLAGYQLGDGGRFNNKWKNAYSSFLLILFAAQICIGYFLFVFISEAFQPVYREIRFIYKFYLTKYYDNIYLNDDYSDVYKTREEKLKRTEEISTSKQMKRHNKVIQNKYK